MNPAPNPLVIQFTAALPNIGPTRSRAGRSVFRSVGFRHLRATAPPPTPLYTQGPMNSPYRYSPPSAGGINRGGRVYPVNPPPGLNPLASGDFVFPGLYAAEDPETAYVESNQEVMALVRARFPSPHIPAMTVLGLEVGTTRLDLLDLTQRAVQAQLGLTRADLLQEWQPFNYPGPGLTGGWAPTQILGYLVYQDTRFQGVRYPSARNRGRPCVFIFTDKLVRGTHRITVGDDPNPPPPRQPAQCCGLALQTIP